MKRTKTHSKNFYDDEIHHIEIDKEGRKVLHLHEWVHRTYNPYTLDYDQISHRNQYLDYLEKVQELYKKLYGSEDYSELDEG